MMTLNATRAGLMALLVGLGACAQEVGNPLSDTAFGAAANTNAAIMSGDQSYMMALGQRFAAEVPSTITFAFDSATLDAEARAVLDQQANWIRQFPEVRFRVYGHTDAVGSATYNKGLGLRRAQAVVAYLGTRGISRARLEAVASFGETQPVIPTQARERQNRRTVTEVSGFVSGRVNQLDGKYAALIQRDYVESAVAETGLTYNRERDE